MSKGPQRNDLMTTIPAVAALLLLLSCPTQAALSTIELELNDALSVGCRQTPAGIRLVPVAHETTAGRIAIEAEQGAVEPYYDITRDKSGGVKDGADASGAAYVDFIKHARYTFATETAGTYRVWYRCSVPSAAKWVHNEQVDHGQLSDWVLAVLPGGKNVDRWGWKDGYSYKLDAGLHELELPIGFRGGPKLDKIELLLAEPDSAPKAMGVEPAVGYVKRVRLVTKKCDIQGKLAEIACPGLADGAAEARVFVRRGEEWQLLVEGLNAPASSLAEVSGIVDFRIDARLDATGEGALLGPVTLTVARDERQLQPISIGNDVIETVFDQATGNLSSLKSTRYASRYIREGASYKPFSITLLREPVGADIKPDPLPADAIKCTHASVRRHALRLQYAVTGAEITVEVRIRPLSEQQQEWSITITNDDADTSVLEVMFPKLDGLAIGDSNLDDIALYPTMDNAAHNFLLPYGEVTQPFVRAYPVGGELAMGFMDIHDPANGGFYFAVADRECPVTMVGLAQGALRGWDLWMEKVHRIRAGTKRTYTYRMGVHAGDWRQAAEWYRAMMDEMFVMLPAPDLVQHSIGYLMVGSELNHYINSGADATLARRMQLGWVQNWWSVNGPFVPYPLKMLGGEQALMRAAAYARAVGCPLGSGTALYATQRNYGVDGNLWNHRISQDVVGKAMPQVANVEAYMEATRIAPPPWDPNYKDMGRKFAMSIDYTEPETRRVYDGWVERYVELYRSAPLYTDTGISLASAPCFNPEHGHFGYGLCGHEATNGLRRLTCELRRENPDMYLICEGFLDRLAYVTGNLVHRHEVKNWIYQVVFPEQKSFCGLCDTNSRPLARQQGDMLAPFIDPYVMGYHLAGRSNHNSWRVRRLFNLRRQFVEWLADARYRDYVETDAVQYSVLDVQDRHGRDGILVLYENRHEQADAALSLDEAHLGGVTAGVRIDMDGGVALVPERFSRMALGPSRAGGIILARKVAADGAVVPVLHYDEGDTAVRCRLQLCNLSETALQGGFSISHRADAHVDSRPLPPRAITEFSVETGYADLEGLTRMSVNADWRAAGKDGTMAGAWRRDIGCGPILLNGGFERDTAFPLKPDDWHHHGGFDESVLLNRNVVHSGSGSLLLLTYSRDAKPPSLLQNIMLSPGTRYTLSGWLRSAFFRDSTDKALNIELQYNWRETRGAQDKREAHRHVVHAKRSNEWTPFRLDFETPAAYDIENPTVKLVVMYKSSFTLRLDDLRLASRPPAQAE